MIASIDNLSKRLEDAIETIEDPAVKAAVVVKRAALLTRNNELGELLEDSRALIYQLISDDVVNSRKMAARSKLIPVNSELQAIAQDRLELAQKIQKLSEKLYDE